MDGVPFTDVGNTKANLEQSYLGNVECETSLLWTCFQFSRVKTWEWSCWVMVAPFLTFQGTPGY